MENKSYGSVYDNNLIDELANMFHVLALFRSIDVISCGAFKFIDHLLRTNSYIGCFVDFIEACKNNPQLSCVYYNEYIDAHFGYIYN